MWLQRIPTNLVRHWFWQALPGTQGIYGLLIAFLILQKIGMLGGAPADLTWMQGLYLLACGIPIGVVGIFSAIAQGKTAAAGIMLIAKRPRRAGKRHGLRSNG